MFKWVHFYLQFSNPTQRKPYFKKNNSSQWKINYLQWYGVKKVLSGKNEPLLITPKASLYLKKMMLYIWWNWKGIAYYKLIRKIRCPVQTSTISTWTDKKQQSMKSTWNWPIRKIQSSVRKTATHHISL